MQSSCRRQKKGHILGKQIADRSPDERSVDQKSAARPSPGRECHRGTTCMTGSKTRTALAPIRTRARRACREETAESWASVISALALGGDGEARCICTRHSPTLGREPPRADMDCEQQAGCCARGSRGPRAETTQCRRRLLPLGPLDVASITSLATVKRNHYRARTPWIDVDRQQIVPRLVPWSTCNGACCRMWPVAISHARHLALPCPVCPRCAEPPSKTPEVSCE